MQAFRKFSAPSALLRATTWQKQAVRGMAEIPPMRTQTFTKDEFNGPRDDEFFRSAEEIRERKQMRANYQRIQSLPEASYEKYVLQQFLVPKKHAEQSFRQRFQLYDWKFALPGAGYILLPTFASELQPINNMLFIITVWLMNSYVWYWYLSPRIAPWCNDGVYELLKEVQNADTQIIVRLKDHIADNERLISWESEVFEVLDITDELTEAQVDLFNAIEGHAFREAIATKLDALVSLETAAAQNIRNRMVTSVREEVKTLFATNKTAKEQAMAQAIAILTAGQGATMGKDIVGEAFTASVKAYQAKYQELPADGDDIYVALQKDMAAVIAPVEFESTGGNVYETNLIKI